MNELFAIGFELSQITAVPLASNRPWCSDTDIGELAPQKNSPFDHGPAQKIAPKWHRSMAGGHPRRITTMNEHFMGIHFAPASLRIGLQLLDPVNEMFAGVRTENIVWHRLIK
mgnify:CR=1 FL=1